jgi:hypothetical protein
VNRAARLAKGVAALAVLAALVGGVPWALWHYVGWPLPHGVPSWSGLQSALTTRGIPETVLLKALACVVWLAWALLVTSVVAEVPATVRGRVPRHMVGPFQPLVARLLTAIVVAAVALGPRGPAAMVPPLGASIGAVSGRPPAAVMVLARDVRPAVPARATGPPPHRAEPVTDQRGTSPRTYVVRPGDTLWGIAKRELGDPLRWSEIYELNSGRAEPGGRTLEDPHWIYPGWLLVLPGQPASTNGHAPPPHRVRPPVPTTPVATTVAPTTTSTTAARVPTTDSPTTAPRPATSTTTTEPVRPRVTAPGSAAVHHGRPHQVPAPDLVELPSGSVVAGSFAAGVLSAVAVGRLRRRHAYRPSAPAPGRDLSPPPLGPTLRHLSAGLEERVPELARDVLGTEEPELPEDDPERREHPDLIEVGVGEAGPVRVALCELAGLAVVGAGADDVVRSWLAAMLARAGPVSSGAILSAACAGRLFPGRGRAPGLRVVGTDEDAVRLLERAVVARSRDLEAADCPDICAYREAHPWEPMPAVVAVLGPLDAVLASRLGPTLDACTRLGLGAVLLGEAGASCLVEVGEDIRVVRARGAAERLLGLRLFGLSVEEATDVLAVLGTAEERPEEAQAQVDFSESAEEPGPARPGPWPGPPTLILTNEAPIQVRLFGPYEIRSGGDTVATGLRTIARELLAWYLLRPDGATIEAAVDTLWPDTAPDRVHKRFWLAATNLQGRLLTEAGEGVKLFVKVGEAYRLAHELVSCDVWAFQEALGRASHSAEDQSAALEALRAAAQLYRGDFAQGTDYLWSEPVR